MNNYYFFLNESNSIGSKKVSLSADKIKPTQKDIYIGKTMGLVIHNMVGGDMKTMVSNSNHIVDGHHRWAATILHSPKEKLIVTKVDLDFEKLVIVLRKIGDSLGNERGANAENYGDKSLYNATVQDIKDAVFKGKYIDKEFYDKDKAIEWWNSIGEKTIEKRLKIIKSYKDLVFDIERKEMPRIKRNQVDKVVNMLKIGYS